MLTPDEKEFWRRVKWGRIKSMLLASCSYAPWRAPWMVKPGYGGRGWDEPVPPKAYRGKTVARPPFVGGVAEPSTFPPRPAIV